MTISATDIVVPVCSKIPLLYLLTQKVAQKFGYVLGIGKRQGSICHDEKVAYRPLIIVCSARALSNGCKSRVSPNSGNYIAKGKGVHREVKSERSRRQTSDLTDRNFIQGI